MHVSSNQSIPCFETVYALATQAAQAAEGFVERAYCIGGFTIRLLFAGPALVPLLSPALAHLEIAPSLDADLTVALWDSASTGIAPASLSHLANASPASWSRSAASSPTNYFLLDPVTATLSMLDYTSDRGVLWMPDARAITTHDKAMPVHRLLCGWMRARQQYSVHAAAVGGAEGGVLLLGKSGAGKSTTALACLAAGYDFAGDDCVLVRPGSVPFVSSLYNSTNLTEDSLRCFPQLAGAVQNPTRPNDEKALVLLYDCYPDRIARGFPLRAILLPQITGRVESRLCPVSPATGLIHLAPSAMSWLLYGGPQDAPSAVNTLAGMVQSLPNYVLELGSNMQSVIGTVRSLLSSI